MKKVILGILLLLLTSNAEEGCSSVSFHFTENGNFYKNEVPIFRYSRYVNVPYLDSIRAGIYITVYDEKNKVRAEAFLHENGSSMDVYMFPDVGDFEWYESFYNCIQPYILSNKELFLKKCYIRNMPIDDVEILKSSIEKLQGSLSCYSGCNQIYDIVVRQVSSNGYTLHGLSNGSGMNPLFEHDELFEPYLKVDSLVRNLILSKMNQCGVEGLGFARDCRLP